MRRAIFVSHPQRPANGNIQHIASPTGALRDLPWEILSHWTADINLFFATSSLPLIFWRRLLQRCDRQTLFCARSIHFNLLILIYIQRHRRLRSSFGEEDNADVNDCSESPLCCYSNSSFAHLVSLCFMSSLEDPTSGTCSWPVPFIKPGIFIPSWEKSCISSEGRECCNSGLENRCLHLWRFTK